MIYGKYVAALCIPRIHDGTNHKLIVSLSRSLYCCGIKLLVYATPSELYWKTQDEKGEKAVFELINYDVTDVVIIHTEALKDKETIEQIISRSHSHNVPVITIGGNYPGCSGVSFDYSAGFEKIVRHVLQDHGVRNFHMIAGLKDNSYSDERIEIVRKVADELDICFDEEDISYGGFWSRPTIEAVEALFVRRRRLPQALICANDSMAVAALGVVKKHGLKVPEDIIITGFDGINEVKYCSPNITTGLCSTDQLADAIAELVRENISGVSQAEYRVVVPKLWKAESCGCEGSGSIDPSEKLTEINNSFYRYQGEEEQMFRMMSRMLQCRDLHEVVDVIEHASLYDIVITLDPECADRTTNPLEWSRERVFGDTVKLIYNTYNPLNGKIVDLNIKELLPDMEQLFIHETPLFFFALHYNGIPMGYVSFGFFDYEIQNYYKVSQIVNALDCAIGAFRTVQYQHYLSDKISEMYRCDGLTHLLNRTALKNEYHTMAERCSGKMTVVLADLDGLKHINDTYGHDDGDFAICAVAQAMLAGCPEDSLCTRWGGDEMLAVIPGEASSDEIHSRLDKYLSGVNATSGKPYHISASIGIRTFDVCDYQELENMIKDADQLMYQEKKRKKTTHSGVKNESCYI